MFIFKAQLSRPFSSCFCNSIVCNFAISSSIPCLIRSCNPSTIAWLVIPVYINSVYGKVILASISQCPFSEFEPIMPLITYSYSSSAISIISIRFRIFTSFSHTDPYSIQAMWDLNCFSFFHIAFLSAQWSFQSYDWLPCLRDEPWPQACTYRMRHSSFGYLHLGCKTPCPYANE